MKQTCLFLLLSVHVSSSTAQAQTLKADVKPLIQASCIRCHDAETKTRLNFEKLDYNLSDAKTFRQWVRIFDRVHAGEMPPPPRKRPDAKLLQTALDSLKKHLKSTNLEAQQKKGRVPSRRLTRLEYAYTIRDLLGIDEDLMKMLPEESDSGSFDTVGESQRISAVHMRSYLKAADRALDAAINLERQPKNQARLVDYLNSPYVNYFHNASLQQGGNITRKLKDAVALFVDIDYIFRSDASGLRIRAPGWYRITTTAYAFQAKSKVTLKLIHASERQGGASLLGAYDLNPKQERTVTVTAYLKPGDYLYPSVADIQPRAGVYLVGAKKYQGEGLAIKSLKVEGPLHKTWPPKSTTQIFSGMQLKRRWFKSPAYQVQLSKKPEEHLDAILQRLTPLAFRRPIRKQELASFTKLAAPAIQQKRRFEEVVRIPLRSLLTSPQFLLFQGKPGELDDFALASRLSYFLWKSMPDQALLQLAKEGKLSTPTVLREQVERMLKDRKSKRFIEDFLGQWLRLYDINATTPDVYLYPEFGDILSQALVRETELFFTELVEKNLSAANLIDSNYTFLNRRLAEHYGLPKLEGQHFRKVTLPKDSVRGGILTQASVLKVTANGTVTSPVTRGNFVLTRLLGTPPNPPPPNVGSIEPDTRGKTTIREILKAHRNLNACAKCHKNIDPPGFALESFDPIGGFRKRYRASPGYKQPFQSIIRAKTYGRGPKVDSSGVTAEGVKFSGIREFKKQLMKKQDQIARHFISQLVVYATGAEIQFADREEIDAIVQSVRKEKYPVRSIIHRIVQSRLFRHQ